MITVLFTCKGRPYLTELCLRRLVEVMPQPYKLYIVYDGVDAEYVRMLHFASQGKGTIFVNHAGKTRFGLINDALDIADPSSFVMHTENDFYWQRPGCLTDALAALVTHQVDFVRFENLPFTDKTYSKYYDLPTDRIGIMKKTAPYRFTFNPHLRRERFPCGRFKEDGFTKQPEQHHNDSYHGVSGCLMGDNFRHLGIYDESGHYKPYYAERFTLRRGEREITHPIQEFNRFCDNTLYRQLFMRYLHEHKK